MKSLRERAENELKTLDDSQEKSVLNAQKLIYELEVSQVELKMQNEELQSAQTEITQLKDTYQELYDDAPVGYLTLNQNGLIETSNLKGAQFLDLPKDQLVGQPLQKSILKAHQDRFHIYLQKVLHSDSQLGLDLRICKPDHSCFDVRLDSIAIFKSDQTFSHLKMTLTDISEYKQAEQKLQENALKLSTSLQEKEVLLQEIHHRVKNNLQMIISMLRLQARSIEEPFAIRQLQDAEQRIQVISDLHETLYQSSNCARIAAKPFFKKLIQNLCYIYPVKDLDLQLEISVDEIPLEQALYSGLVVNELMTNALKYAFPAEWNGQPRLILAFEEKERLQYCLRVADNGVGIPDQLPKVTLGLHLVEMFVKKLKAQQTLSVGDGTSFQLVFKKAAVP